MVKVINTRPAERAGELSRILRQSGFTPVEIPLVAVEADPEGQDRVRALPHSGFTGIFLSSPNGLRHFQEALLATEFERWVAKPFYLVGGAARPLVESAGGRVAFVPAEASLEGFLKEWKPVTEPGRLPLAPRWLHPCSASTRLDPAEFKRRGIDVVNLPVYRPAPAPDAAARLAAEGQDAAAVIFCSGSAVEHFFAAAPALAARLGRPQGPLAVSIGSSTSQALAAKGVEVVRQALHADDASLVDALRAAFGGAKTEVLRKSETPKRADAGAPQAPPAPEKNP